MGIIQLLDYVENEEVEVPRNTQLTRINPFEKYDDIHFKNCYRLSKNAAKELIIILHDDLKHSTKR